jgi:hypothetical protein
MQQLQETYRNSATSGTAMFNEQRKDDYRLRDRHVIGQKLRAIKETELREKETEGSDC